MAPEMQQTMNFEPSRNRFKDNLNNGKFPILIEAPTPEKNIDMAGQTARLLELEKTILEIQDYPVSLAILDQGEDDIWQGVEYATTLPVENRDLHVVYLSGKDSVWDESFERIQVAKNAGFFNIIPVSGMTPNKVNAKTCRDRSFTESITMLDELTTDDRFFSGCVINPFQYTFPTLFAQYLKLDNKLNHNANFVVTECGWDMLKLQSLAWHLWERKTYVPIIVRLMFLTPEKVEKIVAGQYPGIKISQDYKKILHNSLKFSKTQFEAVQYRSLELMAAGCRLLGFAGVQISGAELPIQAKTVCERISYALKEFTDFNQWLNEYNSYIGCAEMAPFDNDFRLYDRMLHRDYPQDNPPESCVPNEIIQSKVGENRYRLKKLLFSNAKNQKASQGYLLKKLLCNCQTCSHCQLPDTQYICPQECPKGFRHGICGGVKDDGTCELSNSECVYCKIVKLAARHNCLPKLAEL
jgi:methylenetetrahydrofolate reductase (NADPH)